MNNQNKTIIILIILIILLAAVFALKVTGIIKIDKSAQEIQEDYTQANITDGSSSLVTSGKITGNKTGDLAHNVFKSTTAIVIVITVVMNIISIVILVGTYKLYKKLSMPDFIAKFVLVQPVLMIAMQLLERFGPGMVIVSSMVSILIGIMGLATSGYYFKSLGLSPYWILLSLLAFIPIAGLVAVIALIVVFTISNIRLGKAFNRGILFRIGLVLLPFIFQPILGYMNVREIE